MKKITGALLIILGIGLGLYFGIWWAFIGGIIQIIEQIRADNLQAFVVAFGVAKIVFAALIGWIMALIAIVPGMVMIKD